MDRERWQKVDRIFKSALELPAGRRAAFLDAACTGDVELRREVESLLAHDRDGSFMEKPGFEDATRLLAEVEPGAPAPGEKLGPYKIIERVGAGGMGVVYRALDSRLSRHVALKLLPPEYTRDRERLLRFEREARAASALNHPNILTVHDIGAEGDAHYIAAEFVEGETLREVISSGALTEREVVEIAVQVADALDVAHEARIVHRDIKPENIMLRRRDRIVKVLDFGLAKLTEQKSPQQSLVSEHAETALAHTETGVVLGTPRYMSPEQVRGQVVDARADIWSLGVTLHEMLAGRTPFEGETTQDVVAAILRDEPTPLPAGTHERLKEISGRSLRKKREERYQTAKEMLDDLRGLRQELALTLDEGGAANTFASGGERRASASGAKAGDAVATSAREPSLSSRPAGVFKRHAVAVTLAAVAVAIALVAVFVYFRGGTRGGPIDSLAVLPFTNAGGDPETEYFSDGITESLINSLSEMPRLKVMSRNSVFRYKGRVMEASEVGKQLGVRAVLTGRVVQRGDRLTVSVDLTDAADNTVIWGNQYEHNVSDVLAVQQEIARDISQRLHLKLSGEQIKQATRVYTDNVEAYQLYLRGRFEWYKFTPESVAKSIDYFKRAIDIDPGYALAYAGLANAYGLQGHLTVVPPAEAYPRAKWAAEKAVELDPDLVEAQYTLASVRLFSEWNWAGTEEALRRALQLNPNSSEAHNLYAAYLSAMGRTEEAKAAAGRALEQDPLSLFVHAEVAQAHYFAREYDEAIAHARKGLELGTHPLLYHVLARALVQKGLTQEAAAELRKGMEVVGRGSLLPSLGHAYAAAGQRAEARKVLDEMEAAARGRYFPAYWAAVVHTGLGENDRAFELLNRAADERFFLLIWLAREPRFDPLRSDPRYPALLARIGLPR